MNNFKAYWNKSHKKFDKQNPLQDNWLDNYQRVINQCKTEVLDLGCGTGNNASHLIENGLKVIACDYSRTALKCIKKYVPKAKLMNLDISKKLPFAIDSFDLVIADLSLHYFDADTTVKMLFGIKRILKSNGYLLARVNSVYDINYGAGQGKKLEENFYYVEGYNKRFFTVEDAKKFFSVIGQVEVKETDITRFAKPKKALEIAVKKI